MKTGRYQSNLPEATVSRIVMKRVVDRIKTNAVDLEISEDFDYLYLEEESRKELEETIKILSYIVEANKSFNK